MKKLSYLALGLSVLSLTACNNANETASTDATAADGSTELTAPSRPECIAPAKPGGGFDLTCKLAQAGLRDTGILKDPMRVTYMPGGVGAVAYNKIVANDRDNGDAIIAFSTGSILNLSQGKFGKFTEKDVKWLAGVGTDYGAIAVNADSPIKDLAGLVAELKKDPKAISFGAGGSVGGQDWMQTAILAKAVGVKPSDMTYVAMEGGGEAITAVMGNHITVVSAGIAEIMPQANAGKLRVLAVFADERLGGTMTDIPTAKEQGYDVTWPVVRGYYMGPDVSPSAYNWWKEAFDKMLVDPKFAEIREQQELLPFSMTGDELQAYVYKRTGELRELSAEYGLVEAAPTK
ncbi:MULTISPECIES: Bug family tripartite tricarboxylate transporter substrate binding protein [unclassified Psychrobacter]|uniref:Bug family tripartite tricarboxylate transporter substrate binding protein n=1 Tax=Psychrobacter TaxID=497 RepID=UPI000EE3263A|nr:MULTISPECIES: tripartite tricarboxylate transporter substrate binding protein [unclassified Psychrobacter]MBE8609769.1 tripartite tricarboxylate transporter substrate binding protein [Pseudomonas lundensis]WLG13039.1 tripartite tricarboxylate transporter substrate binding protein [Psychrobacter cibarius]HCI76753.1 tricarboxylic transporter [Psychrobacter sp.]